MKKMEETQVKEISLPPVEDQHREMVKMQEKQAIPEDFLHAHFTPTAPSEPAMMKVGDVEDFTSIGEEEHQQQKSTCLIEAPVLL
ncbi:hypothetical protein GUJ93_ZPchr0004g38181 [Zizania palustris]|uniref:Uncharacterized protein n=1 Tax=Zizania palustris TaxID=103762 RepID=A0A8J5RZ24_ZIZPA|nr:hypothetical protein GUJ93_ZPchr0004g38181 [Zizania palustris]